MDLSQVHTLVYSAHKQSCVWSCSWAICCGQVKVTKPSRCIPPVQAQLCLWLSNRQNARINFVLWQYCRLVYSQANTVYSQLMTTWCVFVHVHVLRIPKIHLACTSNRVACLWNFLDGWISGWLSVCLFVIACLKWIWRGINLQLVFLTVESWRLPCW